MIDLPIEELNRIKNRIDRFCSFKINAFSPTISPAPKSFERNEIESIEKGILYYVNQGVKQLVFQIKYMGSYCDIYLHKNIVDTFLVSRNGYLITNVEKEEIVAKLKQLHESFDWEKESLSMVIIQSELMPWSVLGKGLVEADFKGYLDSHLTHFEYLKESNLYDKVKSVKDSDVYQKYLQDKETLSASDFKKRYEAHIIRQYDAIESFIIKDFEVYGDGIKVYQEQINHFGKESELNFKPFNILKKVFDDGSEIMPNDNTTFKLVNSDEMLELDFSDENLIPTNIQKVYDWFQTLTGEMEEGIMIKPKTCFIKNLPPAFKVRNNHYLTMIYGVDFMQNFDYNMKKRKIDSKLRCSIYDWMLNWKMLEVPQNEINNENFYLKNLVLDRIMGERTESTLDLRL